MSASASFRHDINFLRAVAVTSVLLFHFGIAAFSGGFAGVDVFFVISGFLMGAIICNGLEQNKFSLANFYIARVKRIIPALIVLCVFCLACGWFLLTPDDFYTQALHVRDSLLFISNETYRDESGYFDVNSHEKWLLHTWSLSVEWQFYLLLPLIIWCLSKVCKSPRSLFNTLFVLSGIAFTVCVEKTFKTPENAFFLLKYRCWEMLVGVLVFLLPKAYPVSIKSIAAQKFGCLFSILSLAAIIFSISYFDQTTPWPGAAAAVPVLATGLLILLNQQYSIYQNAAITWLGSRSYSLYLWHWPLVVLLTYFSLDQDARWIGFAVIASLLAAELSFRYIEEPARKSLLNRFVLCALVLFVAAVTAGAAHWVMSNKGFPLRVSEEVRKILAAKNDRNNTDKSCIGNFTDEVPACQFGSDRVDAVVIGDSHAHSIVTAVLAALPEGSGVSYWGYLACPTVANIASDEKCAAFNHAVIERLKELPAQTPVIVASRFSYYPFGEGLQGYELEHSQPQVHFGTKQKQVSEEFLQQYAKNIQLQLCGMAQHAKLSILLPIPEMRELVPQGMARSAMRGVSRRVSITREDYLKRNGFILSVLNEIASSAECNVRLLDPRDYLCDAHSCFGDQGGSPLYFDDDHLNEFGNKLLIPLFGSLLSD